MFLVTGLGNPGKQYENTPHNAGYLFLDMLREYLINDNGLQISSWENEKKIFNSDICKIKKDGELVGMLQKPLTFMNNSGDALRVISKKFDIDQYILAHDDLDIPLGRYKIQKGKSPKGHRGVLSVEGALPKEDFLRVRIGIESRGDRVISGEEYVLMSYSKKEVAILESTVSKAINELFTDILLL